MCFSPEASFIASAGLAAVSVPTLKMARKNEKIFAAIPLIFAIQQGVEGVQWLTLQNGGVNIAAGYAFLFFAMLLWPVFVPLAVFNLDEHRRHILKWFIGLGALLFAYFLFLLTLTPLSISIVNRCIVYHLDFPSQVALGFGMLYVLVVTGSFMFSSRREVQWFGVITFFSAFIAGQYFLWAFVSVWCFFAALLSSLIFLYLFFRRKNSMRV